MKTVLSIDWDYWFRDHPEQDWGHRETGIFISFIWPIRAGEILGRGMKLEDFALEGEGWKDLPSSLEDQGWTFDEELEFHLAESHGSAYQAIKDMNTDDGLVELINIDAHHDVMYELDPDTEIQCDNWIMALAREGRLSRVVQVYPEWRKEDPDADMLRTDVRMELEELGVEYVEVFGFEELESYHVHMAFFCRSGAWVPPWLDEEFMEAAQSWLGISGTASVWNYDSIEAFHREFDEEQAKKHAEVVSHAIASFGKKT